MFENVKKCKKMQKNAKKLQKNLHISKICCNFAPNLKTNPIRNPKTKPKMNKFYYTKSFGEIQLTTATINRNFRIKVNGTINGAYVSKLVGVRGLLEILGGSWNKLVKFVLRAFNNLTDKCACKIYGGATVTFYAK